MRGVDLPRWVIVPASLGVALLVVPVLAIVIRTDWPNFGSLVTSPAALTALRLSVVTSLSATVLCVVLGVPLSLLLARTTFPGKQLVRTLILLPLVLPPVVSGLALLHTFGRAGLLGSTLESLGISIAFSTVAVVLAQTFVSLPFLVLSLEGALVTAGTRYADIAATLGARPLRVFATITVPLVAPGLLAGTVLAFARALGEFGATLTFAGSLQGTTRTLPLEIYLQRETDVDGALALSLLLIVVALVVVGFSHRRVVVR